MRLTVGEGGVIRLPESLLERLKVSAGGAFEARVERGRLVLEAVSSGGDPFAEALQSPADDALERAMEREETERRRAADAFDDALRKKPSSEEFEKEREDRDRWR